MKVTKCDLCKKKIKDRPIIAGADYYPHVELCDKCGKPILAFLKRNKLIATKDKK